ncbi:MAG: pantetheine-phosphate adenylyltransferase [Firmicutes bacterium]|jgi:pantetheine-phosphate adenylyltransferase|nr:pantetheine-phosphate adenylyltransferase [Bacillota bacterium]
MYPGTFDPITNGHMDIIKRACKLFDEVYVTILNHPTKVTMFNLEERLYLMECAINENPQVKIAHYTGLSVDFCNEIGAKTIVRGLRAMMDFEYEFQIAAANQFLDDDIEMCFLMTKQNLAFVSSSTVKEIASYGGKLEGLVPECIIPALYEKMYKK